MKSGVKIKLAVTAIVVGMFLMSCTEAGTGGGGSTVTPVSVAGPITRGSIIVGGITFDDSQVSVSADEVAQAEGYLENGMTVRLIGTVNADGVTGVATVVEVENELRGPITSIDAAASTFDIFGFTVVVSGETIFDDGESFATLAINDVVEVYGFQLGDGRLRATRVDEQGSNDDLEIRGIISNVTATTFRVGASTIDFTYDGSTVIEGGTSIAVGDLVEAELDSTLYATAIELEEVEDAEYYHDDDVEVEGVVSGFTSAGASFFVGSTRVQLIATTEFDGGDIDNLSNGVMVEAEGGYSGTTLIVREVSFEDNVEIVATADGDGGASALGITIHASALTELENLPGVSDIAGGDPLSIEGFVLGDGSVEAISIERMTEPFDPDEHVLKGPVTVLVDDTTIEILGVTVDLSNVTVFSDDDGPMLTIGEFVAMVSPGVIVEAEGSFSAGTFSALEVEFD